MGTEQDVSPDGVTEYYAWYEMLPAAETPLPSNYIVKPGDTINASLVCIRGCSANKQTWQLTMSNQSENWTWSQNFSYGSSMLSAEWIEEAPYERGVLPLANFGAASFSAKAGVNNGQTPSLSLSTNAIQMEDFVGPDLEPVCGDQSGALRRVLGLSDLYLMSDALAPIDRNSPRKIAK